MLAVACARSKLAGFPKGGAGGCAGKASTRPCRAQRGRPRSPEQACFLGNLDARARARNWRAHLFTGLGTGSFVQNDASL
eukprot:8681395-Alexandrium_andersonii.AAC.1